MAQVRRLLRTCAMKPWRFHEDLAQYVVINAMETISLARSWKRQGASVLTSYLNVPAVALNRVCQAQNTLAQAFKVVRIREGCTGCYLASWRDHRSSSDLSKRCSVSGAWIRHNKGPELCHSVSHIRTRATRFACDPYPLGTGPGPKSF